LCAPRDHAAEPSWSPNSKQLAFVGNFGLPGAAITVAAADGSGRRELVPMQVPALRSPPWGIPSSDLAWSPSGNWLAYDSGPVAAIHLIRPDGTGERTLTPGVAPAWSRDGRRIAFIRINNTSSHPSLWVIGRDGSGLRQLDSASQIVLPAWAPGGTILAYSATRRPGFSQVFVVRTNGGRPRQVAQRPRLSLFTPVFWGATGGGCSSRQA
jgi:Tol biopolymer transport system component